MESVINWSGFFLIWQNWVAFSIFK